MPVGSIASHAWWPLENAGEGFLSLNSLLKSGLPGILHALVLLLELAVRVGDEIWWEIVVQLLEALALMFWLQGHGFVLNRPGLKGIGRMQPLTASSVNSFH